MASVKNCRAPVPDSLGSFQKKMESNFQNLAPSHPCAKGAAALMRVYPQDPLPHRDGQLFFPW